MAKPYVLTLGYLLFPRDGCTLPLLLTTDVELPPVADPADINAKDAPPEAVPPAVLPGLTLLICGSVIFF
jgi:hypothetical protein